MSSAEHWNVPGYTVTRELGAGGGGRVVLAVHERTGAPVAIKYLSEDLRRDEGFVVRFRQEARLLVELNDPHVVRLYEYLETEQGAAIVMELVDGPTLRALLRRQGPTGAEAALTVLKGSLLGLAAAHATGVVHRDYKPENVLVTADGASKLADFGIAVRAGGAPGSSAGTPPYMAPEQWTGAAASPASDVYAATAVFFECLTGHRPYRATEHSVLRHMHQTAPVPVEEVPEPLRRLVARGMAKNPALRPASAAAFVYELERAAVAAYGPSWEERGRSRLAALAAALAATFPLNQARPSETGSSLFTTTLRSLRSLRSKGVLLTAGAALVVVAGGGIGAYALGSAGTRTAATSPGAVITDTGTTDTGTTDTGTTDTGTTGTGTTDTGTTDTGNTTVPVTASASPVVPEETPGETPNETLSETPNGTPPTTPGATSVATPEATPSETPEVTYPESPMPSPMPSPASSPMPSPSVKPSPSPSPTPSPSPSPSPSASPSPSPSPSPSLTQVSELDVGGLSYRAGSGKGGATGTGTVTVRTSGPGTVTLTVRFTANGTVTATRTLTLSGATTYTRTVSGGLGRVCSGTWGMSVTTSPAGPGGARTATAQAPTCPTTVTSVKAGAPVVSSTGAVTATVTVTTDGTGPVDLTGRFSAHSSGGGTKTVRLSGARTYTRTLSHAFSRRPCGEKVTFEASTNPAAPGGTASSAVTVTCPASVSQVRVQSLTISGTTATATIAVTAGNTSAVRLNLAWATGGSTVSTRTLSLSGKTAYTVTATYTYSRWPCDSYGVTASTSPAAAGGASTVTRQTDSCIK
ncbi:serine/threonine-protein kinase [Microbispora hainanensis]|uniref:serine/threonine-protein kinase n=1 Tax=Microbispora hainanensis TaxID=568844 RepID=UPI0033DF288E